MGRGAISFYSTSFPPLFQKLVMRKASLNEKQATFLIDFIKNKIDSIGIDVDKYEEFILLVQIHDILTGNHVPNNNLPDESLRGNDSCTSGKCD